MTEKSTGYHNRSDLRAFYTIWEAVCATNCVHPSGNQKMIKSTLPTHVRQTLSRTWPTTYRDLNVKTGIVLLNGTHYLSQNIWQSHNARPTLDG